MAFLSEILGHTITDIDGRYVGKLEDLIAREIKDATHPIVDAVVIKDKNKTTIIPYLLVMALFAPSIPLKCRADEITQYHPAENDIFLSRDVLDKQIIDTDGARVVRVNDLELVRVNGTLYVGNVDIGMLGVLRRLGVAGMTQRITSILGLPESQTFISWDDVELLRHDPFMRLRVPVDKISELHPADVAEIISDMNKLESGELLEALNMEQLADTLEEVETEFQADLVENMSDEKVADILEEMEPDEAADLLAELPEERSRDLLALMQKEESEDVRKLLSYPEDSAGGIMTTEYACVPPDVTAEEAIRYLRQNAGDAETLFYVYVTDTQEHLKGVFSLKGLIFADPAARVEDFMEDRVKSVNLTDEQDEVAQVITKYDLLAIPVVDDQNVMHGIVTADDALDKIIPTAWKKRLPRFYH
ncbi:MAG TPA: CBS domain-containing protein [Anaerolineales bacterium]|nr:CBS domain-containing protein [Anaerolineales bacterium]